MIIIAGGQSLVSIGRQGIHEPLRQTLLKLQTDQSHTMLLVEQDQFKITEPKEQSVQEHTGPWERNHSLLQTAAVRIGPTATDIYCKLVLQTCITTVHHFRISTNYVDIDIIARTTSRQQSHIFRGGVLFCPLSTTVHITLMSLTSFSLICEVVYLHPLTFLI